MTTKAFHWMVLALLTIGLGTAFTSCKDDDDDSSEQRNADADPQDTDEAEMAWRWLCQLTDAETLDQDWTKKTYEPTVGVASENNANTRIVVVNDLDEAKTQFACLADVDASQLSSEYNVAKSGVGSMTWTPSPSGAQNLAEVTVDTKLIPTLQRIVYCTPEQVGVNGIFGTNVDATAFYRLGDIIKDKTTGQYWVCVRPSFKQGDKGKSHWISIFNSNAGNYIPEDNLKKDWNKLEKYDNRTIILPTKLKYSREHMHNLTNLVYAILRPAEYASKVGTDTVNLHNNGLCGFDYKYHGIKFLNMVGDYWKEPVDGGKSIWELLFNRTYDQMQSKMSEMVLLYNGYHWVLGLTGDVHEYKAAANNGFTAKLTGSDSGDKVRYDFGGKGFDVTRYASYHSADQTVDGPQQFVENGAYRWLVAYATGDQLMKNGKYSPYEHINGFDDIYRFNQKTGVKAHDGVVTEGGLVPPTKKLQKPVVGCVIGSDGEFYSNANGIDAVAIVVNYDEQRVVEEGTNYHGLAMAFSHIKDDATGNDKEFIWGDYPNCTVPKIPKQQWIGPLYGLLTTQTLVAGCENDHDHLAAKACYDYPKLPVNIRQAKGFSNWFLPSSSQWQLALKGMGLELSDEKNVFKGTFNEQYTAIENFMEQAGVKEQIFKAIDFTWTSTLEEAEKQFNAVAIYFFPGEKVNYSSFYSANAGYVLPFIAF